MRSVGHASSRNILGALIDLIDTSDRSPAHASPAEGARCCSSQSRGFYIGCVDKIEGEAAFIQARRGAHARASQPVGFLIWEQTFCSLLARDYVGATQHDACVFGYICIMQERHQDKDEPRPDLVRVAEDARS